MSENRKMYRMLTHRSLWYSVAEEVANDEKRVDYNVTGDADVNYRGVVQFEFRSDQYSLERVEWVDY
ncbi:hypothetical protein WN55_04536 [Dufourea novaeangliae]|uniref:Uncharacterized protein n=1 Tax=Dufourea novaeangliae TaxID=178035 RepID=A0A154P0Z4_DUFNO|nr:hypothetical protein WN55_04536 [Dufourea novaeangliae]